MREIPITADLRTTVFAVQELTRGRNNATGEITLDPGATTTTILDPRISPRSRIFLMPISPTAAAEAGSIWIQSVQNGQVVIAHSNTADIDKRFNILIMSRDDEMTEWSSSTGDAILMETGDYLLMETGDRILLE